MFAFAKHSQGFKNLIGDGFKLYRQVLIPVIMISFFMALAGAIPQIHAWVAHTDPYELLNKKYNFFYLIFQMLFSTYFVSIILLRIYHLAKQSSGETFLSAASVVWHKLPQIIFAMLITTVSMMIGLVAFILPGIFVAVLMMFYLPLILFDDYNAWSAVRESCKLVWGHWWKTFFILFIPLLLIAVITALINIMIGEHNRLGQILAELVVMTVLMPWFNSAVLVQFNELKLLKSKEGK